MRREEKVKSAERIKGEILLILEVTNYYRKNYTAGELKSKITQLIIKWELYE